MLQSLGPSLARRDWPLRAHDEIWGSFFHMPMLVSSYHVTFYNEAKVRSCTLLQSPQLHLEKMLTTFVDDKSPHCIPFILSRLHIHQSHAPDAPFFIGLNGVQGAGKTTLVRALSETLRVQAGLQTLVLSIDDLYLKHEDQIALAATHPDNPLVQHRGEPGRTLCRMLAVNLGELWELHVG